MKKLVLLTLVFSLLIAMPILAVTVTENDKYIMIDTSGYSAYWNKPAQMGYMQAFVGGSANSIIGEAGRAFYHSSNYDGAWSDWGALLEWEIVSETAGRATIQYVSRDAKTKTYTCVATYYDSVPYIKHELTITNSGAPSDAFVSGHEPQFEVGVDTVGMEAADDPYPHAVYWTADGYFGALYGPDAVSASTADWGGRSPGRMQLTHDGIGGQIGNGQSASITYYVAFGSGGRDAALALLDRVQEDPAPVSPAGSATTTWGDMKAR